MWLPKKAFELLEISHESLATLREEVSVLKAENTLLKTHNQDLKVEAGWLRNQFNDLQFQNKSLLRSQFGINAPAPQLVEAPRADFLSQFHIDDMGDEAAAKFGLPTYDLPKGLNQA